MRRLIAILVLGVLVASCSGAGDTDDRATTRSPATTQAAAAGTIDGLFDVGGHQLYLACQGSGSPTLVYLHGLGDDSEGAASIYAPLTNRARVCVYDRVNVGKSGSEPGRHTGADSVRELHALLDAAAVRGPYLLVGWSFGGLLATMYAGTYPDQVVGMLLLDSTLPTNDELQALVPKDERARAVAEVEANPERVEVYRTLDQAKAVLGKVPDVPVTFMAAEPVELPPTWPVERMRAFFRTQRSEFVSRFPQGRLVRVRSSHDIASELPDRVLQEAEKLLSSS